jgi:SAM-dependent methyltransferase
MAKRKKRPSAASGRPPSETQAKAGTGSFARSYLKRLGPQRTFRPDETQRMWNWLGQRHPRTVTDPLSGALDSSAPVEEAHAAKNATLNFSLDVSFAISGDLYEKQMTWFEREFAQPGSKPPARVLDVGCENGLLTCFYASLWPNAEIVGVDVLEEALSCARGLSKRLGLNNLRFVHGDLASDLLEPIVGRDFDFVLFSRTMLGEAVAPGELVLSSQPKVFSDLDVTRPRGWQTVTSILRQTRELLAPAACAVALERLAFPCQTVWFANACEEAGLAVDWDRSLVLLADETGASDQRFPILVSTRTEGQAEHNPDIALVFHDYDQLERLSAGGPLTGGAAEGLARSLRLDELLFSAALFYEPDTERIEYWRSGGILLEYRTSSLGFREATLHSFVARRRVERRALQELEAKKLAGVRVELDVPAVLTAHD